ncbi:MAG: hypothetical protein AAFX78_16335 [Cyanobacteria bacterium J06638_20]
MTGLTPATRRRLLKLRQVPSVWEGDRRLLGSNASNPLLGGESSDVPGDCVLWVDGVDESVRAIDMIPSEAGPEAVVRTLLKAMETPTGPHAQPARPQRILVCNREMQFFLRGVLQDLDIAVEYTADLPLIDEIFHSLQEFAGKVSPQLPEKQAGRLEQLAYDIWQDAPWENLDEEKIFSVRLNYRDVDTLYVSILGLLGMEYGLLMYRSLESLKRFRQEVMGGNSQEEVESAFMQQDCFFLTYDPDHSESNGHATPEIPPIMPTFGSIHPLEGMQPIAYEEDASIMVVALEALHRFFGNQLEGMDTRYFPKRSKRYRIDDPMEPGKKVSITVATEPTIAEDLAKMGDELMGEELDDDVDDLEALPLPEMLAQLLEQQLIDEGPVLQDTLMPPQAFYSLGAVPLSMVTDLRETVKFHQSSDAKLPKKLEWFPVILVQTTRPKALEMIEAVKGAGGLQGICFNPGEDPLGDQSYDLGILQLVDGGLQLFGEFEEDDPVHVEARRKWDERCKKTKGQCGLVIARGVTGAARGNPGLKDMMGFFEVQSLSAEDLGLGRLQMVRPYDDL